MKATISIANRLSMKKAIFSFFAMEVKTFFESFLEILWHNNASNQTILIILPLKSCQACHFDQGMNKGQPKLLAFFFVSKLFLPDRDQDQIEWLTLY